MLFKKAVIILCISILNLSWVQAIPVEKEAEGQKEAPSLFEIITLFVTQNSTIELTTEKNRSSNDSASKSITSVEDNSLSDEDSSTDNYLSENGSYTEDSLLEEDSSGDGYDDADDYSSEKYYDNDKLYIEYEYYEIKSELPVTTTEEFTFEEPASTTVANKDASEKAGSTDKTITHAIIIVVSVFAVITLLILLTFFKFYYAPRKATHEKDGADQTFISADKFMTIRN